MSTALHRRIIDFAVPFCYSVDFCRLFTDNALIYGLLLGKYRVIRYKKHMLHKMVLCDRFTLFRLRWVGVYELIDKGMLPMENIFEQQDTIKTRFEQALRSFTDKLKHAPQFVAWVDLATIVRGFEKYRLC